MAKKLQQYFATDILLPTKWPPIRSCAEKIEQEYPPKAATHVAGADSLSELLRRSIRESGRSLEDIAGAAGVSPIVIVGFMSGDRDIHMATADRLARSLGFGSNGGIGAKRSDQIGGFVALGDRSKWTTVIIRAKRTSAQQPARHRQADRYTFLITTKSLRRTL